MFGPVWMEASTPVQNGGLCTARFFFHYSHDGTWALLPCSQDLLSQICQPVIAVYQMIRTRKTE